MRWNGPLTGINLPIAKRVRLGQHELIQFADTFDSYPVVLKQA